MSKGQVTGMPFQMIFTVILIAVALFVAFWAIRHFMSLAEQGKINTFVADLKTEVNSLWTSPSKVNVTKSFSFSTKFGWICFANLSKEEWNTPAELKNFNKPSEFYVHEKDNLLLLGKELREGPDSYLGVAEKYHTKSGWHISCDGKECLFFEKNPTCIQVKEGKVKIRFEKDPSIGADKIKVSSGWP